MAHSNPPPPVTLTHRMTAFCIIRPKGLTFTEAMASPAQAYLIETKAKQIRTAEWMTTQARTVVPVKRVVMGADGHPTRWCTHMGAGPLAPDLLGGGV